MKENPIYIIKWYDFFFVILFVLFMYSTAWSADGSNETLRVSLKQALDIALQSNRSLIATSNSFQSANLSLESARSEFDYKLYPSARAGSIDGDEAFGGGIKMEKNFETGIDFSISPSVIRNNENHSGNIDLAVDFPLMRGRGKEVNMDYVDATAFSYRSAERALYQTKTDTVIQTVTTVYYVLEYQKTEALLEDQIQAMKNHADTARIKKSVGLATEMDVYRALIQLKNLEDNLSTIRSSLTRSKDALKRILAMSLEQPIEVEAPWEIKENTMALDDAVQIALQNRVEMAHARDSLREAERKSSVARHNLLPQLDFVVSYERYSDEGAFKDAFNMIEDRWTANLVSTTDWARTQEKSYFQQSLLNIRNAELALQSQKDEVVAQVRNQMEVLENWKERIQIRKDQIVQAKGKQKLARLKFDHDMADNFDLVEAESELYQATVNLLSVETEYIVNHYRLRSVLGILFDQKGELNLG